MWRAVMSINVAKLESILQNLVTSTSDVQGAALVSPDGLPLASTLPSGMDEERVSAMSAAMLSLGERIGNELARGEIDRLYVEGDKGYGILTSCGEEAVLLVLASKAAKQGVLMLEIKRVVENLKTALG
jgi:predicted regulator of Ras-like GTPase activity (Roadblock/LC7/MglB family)